MELKCSNIENKLKYKCVHVRTNETFKYSYKTFTYLTYKTNAVSA